MEIDLAPAEELFRVSLYDNRDDPNAIDYVRGYFVWDANGDGPLLEPGGDYDGSNDTLIVERSVRAATPQEAIERFKEWRRRSKPKNWLLRSPRRLAAEQEVPV